MVPCSGSDLVWRVRCLREACLGIIKRAYPETKSEHREEYAAAFRSVGVKTNSQVQQHIQAQQKRWVQLFKVRSDSRSHITCGLSIISRNTGSSS